MKTNELPSPGTTLPTMSCYGAMASKHKIKRVMKEYSWCRFSKPTRIYFNQQAEFKKNKLDIIRKCNALLAER
jgi:hypothetical protein